jgi:integrase
MGIKPEQTHKTLVNKWCPHQELNLNPRFRNSIGLSPGVSSRGMDDMPVLKRGLTRWLVVHRAGKTPSTRRFYWQVIKQIRRAWHSILERPLDQVNGDDVARFAAACDYFCASRWNGMLTVLHELVPVSRSLKRRPLKLTRPPPPTQQEFARLIEEAEQLARSHAALVVEFLACTGLRIGSARALRWPDVHADRIEYIGKGGRLCSVPIINGLRSSLERLRELDDGNGFVLPRASIRRGLAKACERAGLRTLNHHDFRHMFITRCVESGVDLPTIARWIGHNDGGALLSKRYFHLLDGHSQEMAARVKI